jgi:Bacteriophytochrome (light-regulated signal transduction histidine kinase)
MAQSNQAQPGPLPGYAVTNAYTIVATLYCFTFSLVYYFFAHNIFLSVIHALALIAVGINYLLLKRSGNYQRTGIILTTGTLIVICLFATGGWGNTGFLWPFAYLPFIFFLAPPNKSLYWVMGLVAGCAISALLQFTGVIYRPYSPIAILNFFACLMMFMVCNYFIKQKALYYEKMLEEQVQLKTTELAQKNADLAASNAQLEQFAFFASHDLQEPLNTTSGFVKLLKQKYAGRLDQEADQYLNYIDQSSTRMKALITELLEWSRIGWKKELAPVDCNHLLQEVLADLNDIISRNAAVVKAGQLPVLHAYAIELKLLFQNLVTNAIKFRQQDRAPEIWIAAEKKEGCWQFSFTDNGIGIDPQFHEKIFGLFKRLHNRTQYQGSGIGLAHCKKIAELHGGKIWVESELGKGSSFCFTVQEM